MGVVCCFNYYKILFLGTLPTTDGDVVTRSACVQTMKDECENPFPVTIKICQGYYIYNLKNTPTNSSYCFGNYNLNKFYTSYQRQRFILLFLTVVEKNNKSTRERNDKPLFPCL